MEPGVEIRSARFVGHCHTYFSGLLGAQGHPCYGHWFWLWSQRRPGASCGEDLREIRGWSWMFLR